MAQGSGGSIGANDDCSPTMVEVARWSAALDVDAWGLLARLLGIDAGQDRHVVE